MDIERERERAGEGGRRPVRAIGPGKLGSGGEEDKQEIDVAESGELFGFLLQAGLTLRVGHLLSVTGLDPLDGELHSPHAAGLSLSLSFLLLSFPSF